MALKFATLFFVALESSIVHWTTGQETQQCSQEGVCSGSVASIDDTDPRTYLSVIKDVTIPSLEMQYTITLYKLYLNLGDSAIEEDHDDNYHLIYVRYSRLLKLKEDLRLPKFDSIFPPKYFVPDAIRCFLRDLDECNKERKIGLAVWLKSAIDHVCANTDEATTKQAEMIKSFLLDDKTITETAEAEADEKAKSAISEAVNSKLEAASKEAKSHDDIVRAWWQDDEKRRGGECKIESTSANMSDWIRSGEFLGLEDLCPDFGNVFGWWGNVGCPAHLSDIVNSLNGGGCKAAEGGKGGIPPIICRGFVMKTAKPAEEEPIKSLLYTLTEKKLAKDKLNTLLLPVCRMIKAVYWDPESQSTRSDYFTISPKLSLEKKKGQYPWAGRFDLKGNWDHDARFEDWNSSTLKDRNLHMTFPKSFRIVGQLPNHDLSIAELVVKDSELLAELGSGQYIGHLDYSILADIVELPPPPNAALALQEIQRKHDKFPLIWGSHDGKTYAAAIGLIDLYMRFDKRSSKDIIGANVFQAMIDQCTPKDVDPLRPNFYRTRFAKMVGYNVPGNGSHARDNQNDPLLKHSGLLKKCGACYTRSSKYRFLMYFKGRKEVEYTCFTSDYQQKAYNMQQMAGGDTECPWSD